MFGNKTSDNLSRTRSINSRYSTNEIGDYEDHQGGDSGQKKISSRPSDNQIVDRQAIEMSQEMCMDVDQSDSFKRALGINDTVVNDDTTP